MARTTSQLLLVSLTRKRHQTSTMTHEETEARDQRLVGGTGFPERGRDSKQPPCLLDRWQQGQRVLT